MAQEIELKLALGASGPHALRQHPRLANHSPQRAWLANTYYDTPERALERARIALRIRRTPDGYLQTLKTAGSGQGGLHARGEWEWPIDGDELDIDGIRQHAPDTIDEADLDRLAPRFTTDFTRERWEVTEADAIIEVALDIGTIHAGERQVAIRELELELKEGSADALWQLAASLADGVALRPANASKAQRGAALHDGWTLPDNTEDAQSHWNAALEALDAWQDTGHADYRHQADRHLETLGGDAAQRLASALRHADDARPDTWLTPEMSRDWLAAWHYATA
ncbi:CYTH domain-containing protein [Chromohalobacter nigrandesensis]|uniref:CYTH domain-containing protein n=1 Tax=Chromohalobacter nigrandesensis TaxID=119863 RepID=UPI001FF3AF81|nr:CYTH domain-containing protein [Chromohalobacter nigrandesensis]MCK0746301.1 CYTH domain-containing protein [Chromohalobacter nigrandesensis]